MSQVFITQVSTAQPDYWVDSDDAAARISAATMQPRRIAAIVKGSRIARRATAIPPSEIACLGGIGSRNAIYRKVAPELARRVTKAVIDPAPSRPPGCLVSSSCTGYMVPAWDLHVRQACDLPTDIVRVPITQAGCSGGGLAIARAAEYLRCHPDRSGLAVSVELCSLAFQADCDPGNLISTLLFGDSAGAALLEVDAPYGLEILAARSAVVPGTEDSIGFDLTDNGFFPRLALDLGDVLAPQTVPIVEDFLAAHELHLSDVSFFLVHPGGPRILDRLQEGLGAAESALCWSFESLLNLGNTSSAAIFDVIERYLHDRNAPSGWGLIIAFGPGISIELLLVHRS